MLFIVAIGVGCHSSAMGNKVHTSPLMFRNGCLPVDSHEKTNFGCFVLRFIINELQDHIAYCCRVVVKKGLLTLRKDNKGFLLTLCRSEILLFDQQCRISFLSENKMKVV